MAEYTVLAITSFLAFALTAITAYFVYRMHMLNVDVPAGRTTSIALAFLSLNRLIILLSDVGIVGLSSEAFRYVGVFTFLLFISILTYGFWQLLKTFEESELIEKSTMKTICSFDKKYLKRILADKFIRRKKTKKLF